MKFYKFKNELVEAVILERPNRFIMKVKIGGEIQSVHCPVTGKIGRFEFKNVPCLLSVSDKPKRKTKFTVEAISPQAPESKRKSWIGINQTKSNDYLEFFLKNNLLPKIYKNNLELKREVKLGNSRIDFKLGDNFLEVKTLVNNIPFGNKKEITPPTAVDRLIKHFQDLEKFLKKEKGKKAIVLLCNHYKANPFVPPKNSQNTRVGKSVRKATLNGVENWQVNLKITKKGVYFLDYFKLDLF